MVHLTYLVKDNKYKAPSENKMHHEICVVIIIKVICQYIQLMIKWMSCDIMNSNVCHE